MVGGSHVVAATVVVGSMAVMIVVMFIVTVVFHSANREHEHEKRKDNGLNEPDEKFEAIDAKRDKERREEGDDQEKHASGKNVAKETEAEAEDSDKF